MLFLLIYWVVLSKKKRMFSQTCAVHDSTSSLKTSLDALHRFRCGFFFTVPLVLWPLLHFSLGRPSNYGGSLSFYSMTWRPPQVESRECWGLTFLSVRHRYPSSQDTSLCYELPLQVRFSDWRANLRSATPSTMKMIAAHCIQILSPYSFFNNWYTSFFSFLLFRECISCIFLAILDLRGRLWRCRCTYVICTSILSGDIPLGNPSRWQVLENGGWQRLTAQEDLI